MDNLNRVERRTVIESKDKFAFKALQDRVREGDCTVQELRVAEKKGTISKEQYSSLVSLHAERLEGVSKTDSLTGLFNLEFLKSQLERSIAELNSNKDKRKLSSGMVMFFDIRHFREFNNTHGHIAGNEALNVVANALKKYTRRGDVISRFGGDEFVVLLSIANNNPRTLEAVFESKKKNINNDLFSHRIPFSISMGFKILDKEDNVDKLIEEADKKMYEDKNKTTDN